MTEITQQRQNEHSDPLFSTGVESGPLVAAVRSGEPTSSSIKPPEADVTQPTKITEFQWKFAEETHQYVREYIRQADLKAAFFFAGTTALIAFLYKAKLIQLWLKLPTQWRFLDMLSFVTTIGLAISVFACLVTVFPRLKGSKRGYVFFGAIAEFDSAKEYATDVLQRDIPQLMEAKLCHVYDLAKVCGRKYLVLQIGQWAGAIGVVGMVLLLLLVP